MTPQRLFVFWSVGRATTKDLDYIRNDFFGKYNNNNRSSAADSLSQKMRSFLAAVVFIPAVAVAAAETPLLRGEGVKDQASAPPNRM